MQIFLAFLVFPLLVLYKTNKFFKFYAKFTFSICVLVFFKTVLLPIFLLRPRSLRNSELMTWLGRMVTPIFGLKYIIEGKEHLPTEGGYIIVANHQTPLDFLGQCACCGVIKNVAFTCNRTFSYVGTLGLAGWLAGMIFIERQFSRYTENQLNGAIEKIKKEKAKVWFFPEGRLSMDYTGEMKLFRKGAFHCAIKANVPIVPIVFSPNTWFDRAGKKFDGGTVVVKILPPVPTDDFTAKDVNELLLNVRNMMVEHFTELKNLSQNF